MPNTSKQANNICDLMLSEITAVINDYQNSFFIFADDMNCNLHDNYSIPPLRTAIKNRQ